MENTIIVLWQTVFFLSIIKYLFWHILSKLKCFIVFAIMIITAFNFKLKIKLNNPEHLTKCNHENRYSILTWS